MKLYETDRKMEELAEQLDPCAETTEAAEHNGEVMEKLRGMAGRENVLTFLAKVALNAKEEAEEIKHEAKRMRKRKSQAEEKEAQMIAVLGRECGGERTDLGVATLCYRTVKRAEITDADAAFAWLQENGYAECYKIPKPEIYKDSVGRLIDKGIEVPGVKRVTEVTCYLEKTPEEEPEAAPADGGKAGRSLFRRRG